MVFDTCEKIASHKKGKTKVALHLVKGVRVHFMWKEIFYGQAHFKHFVICIIRQLLIILSKVMQVLQLGNSTFYFTAGTLVISRGLRQKKC